MKIKSRKPKNKLLAPSNRNKKSNGRFVKGRVSEDDKSFIPLTDDNANDDESNDDFESMGLPRSFTPEHSDSSSVAVSDEDEVEGSEDEEEDRIDWGKKLKSYYVDGSDEESDDELMDDRINEAKLISDELYDGVDEADAEIEAFVDEGEEDEAISFEDLKSLLSSSLKSSGQVYELPDGFFNLPETDRLKVIKNDHPEFISLLKDFKAKLEITNDQVIKLLDDPDSFKLCTKNGIDYLDLRNELLLMYISYLCYYLLLKTHGVSIEDHPVINRLLELRIILDKTKPIENRLQYQITKLLDSNKLDDDEDEDVNKLHSRLDLMEDVNMYKKKKKPVIIDENMGDEEVYEDEKMDGYMKSLHDRERYEMESMRRLPMNKRARKEMKLMLNKKMGVHGTSPLSQLTGNLPSLNTASQNGASITLNTLAQRMKNDILKSKRGNLESRKDGGARSVKRDENSLPKDTFNNVIRSDDIDMIRNEYKRKKKELNTKTYEPKKLEIIHGKRDIGKDIMKNRGLTVKRDKTKGNARVQNRIKFEKKKKKYNAITGGVRIEGVGYSGEDTGINKRRKKSLTL